MVANAIWRHGTPFALCYFASYPFPAGFEGYVPPTKRRAPDTPPPFLLAGDAG